MAYVAATLFMWAVVFFFAPGKRRVRAVDGQLVLLYKPVFRWAMRLSWLFPLVIAIIAMIDPPNKGEGWIVFALIGGFTAIALPTTMELERRRIVVDAKGISQQSAWSAPVSIAWPDVREVKVSLTHGIVVSPKRGRPVLISPYIDGVVTLADVFEENLPALKSTAGVVKNLREMHERYMRNTERH